MTKRTYTIEAREVVPGMLLAGDEKPITKVDVSCTVRIICGDMFWDMADNAIVDVRLPGPSPRELLCSPLCPLCELSRDGNVLHGWQAHRDFCPVRRLRLRLWPIRATSHMDAYWIVGGCSVVYPRDVLADFWSFSVSDAQRLREAFCEEEK